MKLCGLPHCPSVPKEAYLKHTCIKWMPADGRPSRQWGCCSISNRKQLTWGPILEAVEDNESEEMPVLVSSKEGGRKQKRLESSTLSSGLMQSLRKGNPIGDGDVNDEDAPPFGYKMSKG